jgi:hypothetical protein
MIILFKQSASDEYELMQLFETEMKRATELKEIVTTTDSAIDQMVYNLYGFSEEEKSIIENH